MNIFALWLHRKQSAISHAAVILTHHPLVLISSSGARRGLWALCGLINWTQRQAGRRGRHPAVTWEGGWSGENGWDVREDREEIMRGTKQDWIKWGQRHWVNERKPQIPVSQVHELHISLFHLAPSQISGLHSVCLSTLRLSCNINHISVEWFGPCCYSCNSDLPSGKSTRGEKKRLG